ncbi:hypothetical protein FBR02_08235 [Anaerolineae bacterium CFX9]|nr:hypothetical protein [Anaerolineae bacterium CFX9]
MHYTANGLQNWIAQLDRRAYAVIIGAVCGLLGGALGIAVGVAGPLLAFGAVLGLFAALYILTSVSAALYAVIVMMALLPFGTLPFRIGFTPTLIDAAMGAFVLVYLLQWMTGRRRALQLTWVHALVGLYAAWLIFSFVLGLRHASPTSTVLRQFAETLLSISMVFILVDLLRDTAALRRLMRVILLCLVAQALIAGVLYVMPDDAAERTLIRLARIGYPDGGVIRYIEDNPSENERAIGTFVDPNVLGGFLAICSALMAPNLLAKRPILKPRWLLYGSLLISTAALILTFSRASMLAFALSVLWIGSFRGYRRFWLIALAGALMLLLLPQTRDYIERFLQVFTASDLATQMRLGEYGDSLELISRYPITGVGFTGTPEIDLYTAVASMYLLMANLIGLVGVGLFALMIAGVFVYGARAWPFVRQQPELQPVFLGAHAALIAVLLNGTADHYYFRLDFQASITLLWLTIALAVTSSRLGYSLRSPSDR